MHALQRKLPLILTVSPNAYYFSRLLDNSRIRQLADCQLADWMTRGLDISRTG